MGIFVVYMSVCAAIAIAVFLPITYFVSHLTERQTPELISFAITLNYSAAFTKDALYVIVWILLGAGIGQGYCCLLNCLLNLYRSSL
jgi:hypothetical protein